MRYSLQRIVSWRSLNDARGDSRVISNEIIACALNRRHEKCHRHLACAVYRRKLAKVCNDNYRRDQITNKFIVIDTSESFISIIIAFSKTQYVAVVAVFFSLIWVLFCLTCEHWRARNKANDIMSLILATLSCLFMLCYVHSQGQWTVRPTCQFFIKLYTLYFPSWLL